MNENNTIYGGYLDVKISAKSRRGLTPWKAWQKQWCELKRLDSIENGIELKLKSSAEGNLLNCIYIPRSSTICRTESRTKNYSFGIFQLRRNQNKPLIFLSGNSERDSQQWMCSIRRMISVATYLPIGESNFHVSLIDNTHSRAAGLVGLYGVLGTNTKEIIISDPCTGDTKLRWQWYNFHQFHLQASTQVIDDKLIVVMHTSGEFLAGPGQIYLFCENGSNLLKHLVARGKSSCCRLKSYKRLSRSEGDLYNNSNNSYSCASNSPICIRSQTGSDDSGVRVSISSDDSVYTRQPKTASSLVSIGMGVLTKTPGGSETNDDSLQDLANIEKNSNQTTTLPRKESGVSLASGIYEEIPEDFVKSSVKKIVHHIYENPLEIILNSSSKIGKLCKPPPLPPRRFEIGSDDAINMPSPVKKSVFPYKYRSNTLPAKDLSRISQIFTSESDYVVMSPSKVTTKEKSRITSIAESLYVPMSPVINLKNKIESCYMSMSGKK